MQKLSLNKLVKISRPRFWIYSLGPFLIGVVAALSSAPNEIHWWVIIVMGIYFATFANLYIYGINDIYDYETDLLNPKKDSYELLVTPELWKPLGKVIAYTTLPFLVVLAFFPWPAIAAMVAFLFFAGQYSAPPIRAKARPLWDSFMSGAHYVSGGLVGFYLAGGSGFGYFGILGALLWAMAMHAFSAVPDIDADKASRVPTVATWFGKRNTIMLCLVLYLGAAVAGALSLSPWILLTAVPYIYLMYKALQTRSGASLFQIYTYFPWVNMVLGFVIFWMTFFLL